MLSVQPVMSITIIPPCMPVPHLVRFCCTPLTIVTAIVVSLLALPGGAAAQGTGDSSLTQELATAPKPGETTMSVTIGGQIQNGRTETKGLTVSGIVAHTTKREQILRFDVETAYARYRAAAGTPSFVAENNQQVSLTALHPVHKRVYVFGMSGWRRDVMLGLDYRAWAQAGAGVAAIAHPKVNAFIGASLSVGKQSRHFTTVGETVLDPGILQTLNVHLTDLLSFQQSFLGHVNSTDAGDDNSYTLNASVTAKVSRHIGMKIYYKRQHDTLHPASVSATQSQIGGGVQISFASKGGR
jgi:putative salt-induced outer membrane protein YdiY